MSYRSSLTTRLSLPTSRALAYFSVAALLSFGTALQGCTSDEELPPPLPEETAESPYPPAQNPPVHRPVPQSPHVIFISLDTTRPDYLGCYGHSWVETPNLDELANESIVFDNCYTPVPTTLSAHTSMFTGTHPHTHGVPRNGFVVNEANTMLAEVLGSAGYHTLGVIAAFPLISRFNIHQGFDVYDDHLRNQSSTTVSDISRSAQEVTDRLLGHIDSIDESKPLFVFAHYFDAHAPYDPPSEFTARYNDIPEQTQSSKIRRLGDRTYTLTKGGGSDALRRLVHRYAGEISYQDAEIGRFIRGLKERNIYDNSIIIVTSDHGETLWDHEPYFNHGHTVYAATTQAIGIVRLPKALHAGLRIEKPVSTIDWMPSILMYLGLTVPPDIEGLDMNFNAPLLGKTERDLFTEATKPHNNAETDPKWYNFLKARSIRTPEYTLIHTEHQDRTELYSRALDPGEHTNLLVSPTLFHMNKARELGKLLDAWAISGDPKPSHFDRGKTVDTRESLRALGYLN